jgi:hypothetical protein
LQTLDGEAVTPITAVCVPGHVVAPGNSPGIISESAEDGHGTLPPNAILFIPERVNMQESPARFEKPVHFLSPA